MKKLIGTFFSLILTILVIYAVPVNAADNDENTAVFFEEGQKAYQNTDYQEAVKIYSKAASFGSNEAMLELGKMYEDGIGTDKNAKLALEYYMKAAGVGNAEAFGKIGDCYFNGVGVAKDDVKALEYYQKGAGSGDGASMGCLGLMYERGYGVAVNKEKAIQNYLRAADKDDAWSLRRLGEIYNNGEIYSDGSFINTDLPLSDEYYQKALKVYRKKADSGDRKAMDIVGVMFKNGEGTSVNTEKSFEYLKRSADSGFVEAYIDMAALYQSEKKDDMALKSYESAVERHSAYAAYELALLYLNGEGMDTDSEKADTYFQQALEMYQNDFENPDLSESEKAAAANRIGYMYYKGYGVEQNNETAFHYIQLSADMGNATGMSNLAHFYKVGIGTEIDYEEAAAFYQKAFDRSVKKDKESIREKLQDMVTEGKIDRSGVELYLESTRHYIPQQRGKTDFSSIVKRSINALIVLVIMALIVIFIIPFVMKFLNKYGPVLQFLFDLISFVILFNVVKILLFHLPDKSYLYGAILYYDVLDSVFANIIKNLIAVDVALSIVSIFDAIIAYATYKRFLPPRLPVTFAIIVMAFQTGTRARKFYCKKCEKNIKFKDMTACCCDCMEQQPIKLMNFSGIISYQCSSYRCQKALLPTTFSRVDPYSYRNLAKCNFLCKNCFTTLETGVYTNISIYADSRKLADNFRDAFFYNAFGKVRKQRNIYIDPAEPRKIKAIYSHYENGDTSSGKTINQVGVILNHAQSTIEPVTYHFRTVLMNDDSLRLHLSEGMVILLDGSSDSLTRQSVADSFVLELAQINTEAHRWDKPVLVGICANNTDELEKAVDSGFESDQQVEDCAVRFLNENGNADIINVLNGSLSNVHYFVYRTGSAAQYTERKIFNIIPPVQALMYSEHKDLINAWKPEDSGFCPPID